MDAILWLCHMGVDKDRIFWIMPRDSWILVRDKLQGWQDGTASLLEARELFDDKVTTMHELFQNGEKLGLWTRLDPTVEPAKYKCATASLNEISELRSIKNVVRMGRVRRLDMDRVTFAEGSLQTGVNTLYVDCSTDGLAPRPTVPVFHNDRISLQSIKQCQQVFSAAAIAHVEIRNDDHTDAQKNALCKPVPHPDSVSEAAENFLITLQNKIAQRSDSEMRRWLNRCRLNLDNAIFPGFLKLFLFLIKSWRKVPSMMNFDQRQLTLLQRVNSASASKL
jgi:hypothetical protein